MSKKSKKILAYLMFVAALCGTPAVSEARGGSSVQVKTEKASTAQRGNLSQSLISYLIRNYGFEVAKWVLLGGGGFGFAKMSKVGDLNTFAKHVLGIKNADSERLAELKKKLEEDNKILQNEKELFNQQREQALENNGKLVNEKVVLELKVNSLIKKADEDKKTIGELGEFNQNLNKELLDAKSYNAHLFNVTVEDKRKLDALLPYLPNLIDSKMSGEFTNSYSQGSGWEGAYRFDQIDLEPYSDSQGSVKVALVEYDENFGVFGEAEKIELSTDNFLNNVKSKAKEKLRQDATNEMIALKDVGLSDFGILGLARYSFVVMKGENVEKLVAAYFPLKSAQEINVENNGNENNEKLNENEQNVNNNVVNNENNENNENVNNEGNNQ